MRFIRVTASLKALGQADGPYEAEFLVDTGANVSLAPNAELHRIGVQPIGKMAYELADGTLQEYPFGLVQISFMGEITAGRVIFGLDDAAPILLCLVRAPSSVALTFVPAWLPSFAVGITVDAATRNSISRRTTMPHGWQRPSRMAAIGCSPTGSRFRQAGLSEWVYPD
jgi:hypothetical protein